MAKKHPVKPAQTDTTIAELRTEIERLTSKVSELTERSELLAIRLEAAVAQRNAEADRSLMALSAHEKLSRQMNGFRVPESEGKIA